MPRPYADVVQGKVRELRVRFSSDNVRILYCFFIKDYIVLLHAFRKKKNRIPVRELELAQSRMHDFMNRYQKGEIKP